MHTPVKAVKSSAAQGKAKTIIGYICGAMFSLTIIINIFGLDPEVKAEAIDYVICSVVVAISVFLIISGYKTAKRISRYKAYAVLIYGQRITSIEKIAASCANTSEFVQKDLQKMIEIHFFNDIAIDAVKNEIILMGAAGAGVGAGAAGVGAGAAGVAGAAGAAGVGAGATAGAAAGAGAGAAAASAAQIGPDPNKQPTTVAADATAEQPVLYKQPKRIMKQAGMETRTCPWCGAPVIIPKNYISECEFCGRPIEGSRYKSRPDPDYQSPELQEFEEAVQELGEAIQEFEEEVRVYARKTAAASLLCGIFGIVFSLFLLIDGRMIIIGLTLAIFAIINSRRAKSNGIASGKATAGLVLGIIGVCTLALMLAILLTPQQPSDPDEIPAAPANAISSQGTSITTEFPSARFESLPFRAASDTGEGT